MHQFLVGRGVRQQEALAIARREAANDASAGHGAIDNGDVIGELILEDLVEFGAAQGKEAVRVGELAKHTNVTVLFKLSADRHDSGSTTAESGARGNLFGSMQE